MIANNTNPREMEQVYRHLPESEFKDVSDRILYEDNHLFIFNKRPGEIVQEDLTGDESLEQLVKAYIAQRDGKPGAVFLGVPHRLDRPVGGIVIFAKTSKALERMNELFRTGQVSKIYWALVCKRPPEYEALLTGYITRNEKINKSYIYDTPRNGAKEARLEYRLIKCTDRFFLLEVQLLTGRHHQIRSQLSHMGCCIKGDLKYGAPRSNPDGSISLHSRKAVFVHPIKKIPVEIVAPLLNDGFRRIVGMD